MSYVLLFIGACVVVVVCAVVIGARCDRDMMRAYREGE